METIPENTKIEIEKETLKYLNTIGKWAMFLAIIGFIFLGLIIVIALIAGTFLSTFSEGKLGSGFSGPLLFVPLLLVAVIHFFPVLFLFRFSKHTAHAVQSIDKLELHKAFKNLRACFVYIGVMIIVLLAIYVVTLAVAGSSMDFLKGIG